MSENIFKKRVTNIFQFIKALNEIRNPVIIDIREQLWSMYLEELPVTEELSTIFQKKIQQVGSNNEYILKVKRPQLEKCPEPNDVILSWIKPGWDKLTNEVQIIEIKTIMEEENKVELKFDDDKERVKAFDDWIKQRDTWQKEQIPKQHCLDLYTKLFKLYSNIQRESESVELVLGDGFIDWMLSDGRSINHPILIQKAFLEFDSNIPEFTIRLLDNNSELYTALFRTIKDIDAKMLSTCIDECTTENYQIADFEETDKFLNRLVSTLSVQGGFSSERMKRNQRDIPLIYRNPVLYLRKRNLGFANMIDTILEDIPTANELPDFLKNVVGIYHNDKEEVNNENAAHETNISLNGQDEEILLSKPANKEQLLVAKYLASNGAVLVQGPPGTGKTHTIANLIGHLLAEGKSILVTSHTEKALKVLKEKVIPSLQPLCLSVLSSKSDQSEMDKTLNEMNEKRTQIQPTETLKEIDRLTNERKKLINTIKEKRNELKLARMDEYRDVIMAGERYTPIEAGKFINDYKNTHSFIPSPVQLGEPCPLMIDELKELYLSNKELTEDEEIEMSYDMPLLSQLIDPDELSRIVGTVKSLEKKDLFYRNDLWNDLVKTNIDSLAYIKKELEFIIQDLGDITPLHLELIDSGIEKGARYEEWKTFINITKENKEFKDRLLTVIFDYSPEIKIELINEETLSILDEIMSFIDSNGKIGTLKLLLNRKWKSIIEGSSVNEKAPSKIEDFKAVKMKVEYELRKEKFIKRWNKQVLPVGGSELSQNNDIIEYAYRFNDFVKKNIDWHQNVWAPLEEKIKESIFYYDTYCENIKMDFYSYFDVNRIIKIMKSGIVEIFESKINHMSFLQVSEDIKEYRNKLSSHYLKENTILFHLINAVDTRDIDKYKLYFKEYEFLYNKNKLLKRRHQLLSKLNATAQGWADSIRHRERIHGLSVLPENIMDAWKWRQLFDEIEVRNNRDINKIQHEINKLDDMIKKLTGELVEKKSWYEKIKRITQQQDQAIQGWRLTMKRVGSRTGKRVPKLLAEARKLMPKCQSSVPVWIMPLNRVAENFDPKENRFDVVIVDEASQADIMALNAIYLGKKVIIVGDDEQVSPSAVGQKTEEVEALIETFLQDIPNRHLFTGEFSIYDLVQASGFKPITLTEHFRCLSPIIQFSNRLSYNGNIKPLRDESEVKIGPPVVAYRVENMVVENKVNMNEAETIASLILACTEMEEYRNKTFGVITLLGENQTTVIDGILQQKMSPIEYVNRKIQCGNPANFQGDERDIVFLSVVDSPSGTGPLTLRSFGKGEMYKKRYNVAASRACDQMWVVHSLNPEIDLKDGDIRLKLIKHAENPNALDEIHGEIISKAESEFEKEVIKRLHAKNYKVVPQWKVGAYRIDLVVEGNGKKLAVECDGEKWHGPEKLQDDMNRQAILERLGWRFTRIRGSEFYKDPDNAMAKVFERLEQLDIPPVLHTQISSNEQSYELIERVKIRASEIRRSWNHENDNELAEVHRENIIKTLNEDNLIFEEEANSKIDLLRIPRVDGTELNQVAKNLEVTGNRKIDQVAMYLEKQEKGTTTEREHSKYKSVEKKSDKGSNSNRTLENDQQKIYSQDVLDFRTKYRKQESKVQENTIKTDKISHTLDFRNKSRS